MSLDKVRKSVRHFINESPLDTFLGGVCLGQVFVQAVNEHYFLSIVFLAVSFVFFTCAKERLKRQHLEIDVIFDRILSRKIEKDVNEK